MSLKVWTPLKAWRIPRTKPTHSRQRFLNREFSSTSISQDSQGNGSNTYGNYQILDSANCIKAYPDPLPVPKSIIRPSYVPLNFFTAPRGEHDQPQQFDPDQAQEGDKIRINSAEETNLRQTCTLAAQVLEDIGKYVKVGATTAELDRRIHQLIIDNGAYPSTLGYTSYPKSCTAAVNNVLAHGIPDDRPLEPEDIVNIDLTVYKDDFHGDTSKTFMLPKVDEAGKELVGVTEESLKLAIGICGPGVPLSEIGRVIETHAEKYNLSVNRQFSGHSIGKRFHQPPYILHHRNDDHTEMQPGDCFTIEPILVQGQNSRGFMWDDGWTLSTESRARSAQFEHQILITQNGADILTKTKARS